MLEMVEKNTLTLASAEADRASWNTGRSIGLYLNTISPQPDMTTASVQEADYDGYARQAVTFSPVFVDSQGALTFAMSRQFNSTPAGNPSQQVRGAYLMDTAGNPLLMGNLEQPAPMGELAQSVRFEVTSISGIFYLDQVPTP